MILVANADKALTFVYSGSNRDLARVQYPQSWLYEYSGAPVTPMYADADGGIHQAFVPDGAVLWQEPDSVTVLAKVDLFRRASQDEADQIMGALLTKDSRMQAIFNAAVTFRSDAEEWPMLVQAAHDLFGEERAAELLAPSGA